MKFTYIITSSKRNSVSGASSRRGGTAVSCAAPEVAWSLLHLRFRVSEFAATRKWRASFGGLAISSEAVTSLLPSQCLHRLAVPTGCHNCHLGGASEPSSVSQDRGTASE